MTCPVCEHELQYIDFFGKNMHIDSFGGVKDGFEKSGDIYRCVNERCDNYSEYYHTRVDSDELKEGYPC